MAESKNVIGNGTVGGALQYLDFLSNKGHVPAGAVAALKTGFSKVMKTLGGAGWQEISVREIDLDNYMARFANVTQGQYNSNSLIDYKSRVKKVVTWYLEFLSKPGWTPEIKPRKRSAQKAPVASFGMQAANSIESTASETAARSISAEPIPSVKTNLIAFPFPLSDGNLATFYLPSTISTSDASRMSRFIESLVVESGSAHE